MPRRGELGDEALDGEDEAGRARDVVDEDEAGARGHRAARTASTTSSGGIERERHRGDDDARAAARSAT